MADAAVATDVDLVFDDVAGTLGGLDVLVNSAGIPGPTGSIDTIDRQAWERTVAVNLNSQYYFARRAVPLLRRSRTSPSLIAMGSVAGGAGLAFRAPYMSTEWAIVGLVKSLAVELGPAGIRVNAILQRALAASSRRPAAADGVAALALFLCSPAARNLTGRRSASTATRSGSRNEAIGMFSRDAAGRGEDGAAAPLSATDLMNTFAAMKSDGMDAVVLIPDIFFYVNREQISRMARQFRIPLMSCTTAYVEVGARS